MKSTNFRIVPLPSGVAAAARTALAANASDHALLAADAPNACPCRHCLKWAEPGERMILFPYASIEAGHPYSETGPIFVHAAECERYSDTEVFPEAFRNGRVLRAYDARQNMIDAAVVNGDGPEKLIAQLLENPETDFIHVRSATRGCYTFGVERA